MQSYDNTEPAIDLTASSPLAFARQSRDADERAAVKAASRTDSS